MKKLLIWASLLFVGQNALSLNVRNATPFKIIIHADFVGGSTTSNPVGPGEKWNYDTIKTLTKLWAEVKEELIAGVVQVKGVPTTRDSRTRNTYTSGIGTTYKNFIVFGPMMEEWTNENGQQYETSYFVTRFVD